MFKRLFVLLLLVAATVSVSTHARASTLSIDHLFCMSDGYAAECQADVSGGIGYNYIYSWRPNGGTSTMNTAIVYCEWGYRYQTVTVWVTDESGATVSRSTTIPCNDAW